MSTETVNLRVSLDQGATGSMVKLTDLVRELCDYGARNETVHPNTSIALAQAMANEVEKLIGYVRLSDPLKVRESTADMLVVPLLRDFSEPERPIGEVHISKSQLPPRPDFTLNIGYKVLKYEDNEVREYQVHCFAVDTMPAVPKREAGL